MTHIIQMFTGLINMISALVQFLINSVQSIINLITHLPDYLLFIYDSINVLPSVFLPFILGSLSLYVIYFLMGRNVND